MCRARAAALILLVSLCAWELALRSAPDRCLARLAAGESGVDDVPCDGEYLRLADVVVCRDHLQGLIRLEVCARNGEVAVKVLGRYLVPGPARLVPDLAQCPAG